MAAPELVDRLAGHRTLGKVPRAELEWLAAHGCVATLAPGDLVARKGQPVDHLNVMLSGRTALFVDRGAGPVKSMEWLGGDVTGVLPYSRLLAPPGDVVVLEPTEILAIARKDLDVMARECFETTTILVHAMVDRVAAFTSSELQNEKMISLGKLSAGLAHELNNPASAIERCAAMLAERIGDSERATRVLAAANLNDTQAEALEAVRASCNGDPGRAALSGGERLDREETISGWLAGHGLDAANAGVLADSEVTIGALDRLAAAMEQPALTAAVAWAVADCSVRSLTTAIQESSARISKLIGAVKGFTNMDQANVADAVDLRASLSNTVAVLRAKAHAKSVAVTLDLEPGLPRVRGFAGELSQIWSGLIDNALDAVAVGGRVEVVAYRDDGHVTVLVRDDGAGIAPEIRDRVFDPFFTTKPLGQGTGLGLDIARRLVRHNDATIEFESRAGETEFRVMLPSAEKLAHG